MLHSAFAIVTSVIYHACLRRKKVAAATPLLVHSLHAFPCNWSVWQVSAEARLGRAAGDALAVVAQVEGQNRGWELQLRGAWQGCWWHRRKACSCWQGGSQADAWYRLQVNRNIAGPLALVAQCHCQPSRDRAHPAFVMLSSLALHPPWLWQGRCHACCFAAVHLWRH